MNFLEPIQVADDIFWTGFPDFEAGFSNNSYLLYQGEESILFDPGPGYPMFRDILIEKIQKICPLDHIRYIIVHHQDPDLCGMIPYLERYLSPDLIIIAHSRTSLFLPYYGIRKPIASVQDGDVLILKTGRRIRFIFTPYLHFAGSMMSYDERTKALFSSDIFGVLDKDWKLYAEEDVVAKSKFFLEFYTDSKEAALYTYRKLKELPVELILPQHGSIVKKEHVEKFIEMLKDLNPGKLLHYRKGNVNNQTLSPDIIQEIKAYLQNLIDKEIHTDSLNSFIEMAAKHSITSLLSLYDFIESLEKKYGIMILNQNQEVTYDLLKNRSLNTEEFIKKVYKKINVSQKNIDISGYQKFNAYKKEMIVMNVDIRRFTSWSQRNEVEEVFRVLNKEIQLISEVIQSFRGRINKILGDGVLAFFYMEHVNESIRAAIRLHNRIFKEKLLPVGISFATGEVMVGDIGNDEKVDYTLIGNAVNQAFRINTLAEKGEVVITKKYFDLLGDLMKKKIRDSNHVEENIYRYRDEEEIEYIKFKVVRYKD